MRLYKALVILFFALLTSTILFTNCGQPQALKKSGLNGIFSVKPQKVLGISSHRQVLPSYMSCLGLQDQQIASQTRSASRELASTLSVDGSATSINAPMMMAIAKIAGEVCRDLIAAEKAKTQRKFFPGFDFEAPANSQTYDLESTIQTFANACWSRGATEEESMEINKALKDVGLFDKKNGHAALFICTTMIASGEAVRR